jgi:hypothetical protein
VLVVLLLLQEDVHNRQHVGHVKAAAKKQFEREYDSKFREDQAAMVNDMSTAHAERRTAVAATR